VKLEPALAGRSQEAASCLVLVLVGLVTVISSATHWAFQPLSPASFGKRPSVDRFIEHRFK
jgi:hypothetical protein